MSGGWIDYDYAVVHVVPHVHLGLFVPAAVVLHARTARFLGLTVRLDEARLAALAPDVDRARLGRYLAAYEHVSRGGPDAGPIGILPPSERFHWLTAPRSAVVQSSAVRTGRTRDPEAELVRLCDVYLGRCPE